MRLALVISSLAGGGAERMMAALANAWVADGVGVTLVTLALRSEDGYPLRPEIVRVELGLMGDSRDATSSLLASLRRVRALRCAIKASRPDAVVSFMTTTNLLVLLAVAWLRVPVIVSERTFVGAQPPRGVLRSLYRFLYRRAAAVVVQTRRGAADLEARVGRRVHVIPNWVTSGGGDLPCDTPEISAAVAEPVEIDTRVVLGVGRLGPEKGFDLLIDAFSRVSDRHPSWRLVILGEGPARADLTALISAHRLGARVSLPGFTSAPRAFMREAALFVLSSRFEGMPNALIEAMSEGLACVSFDCPTGPGELIDHGVNGWLVPAGDTAALAVALDRLMGDDALRERLGTRAGEIKDAYSQRAILELWNALLAEVMRPSGGTRAECYALRRDG